MKPSSITHSYLQWACRRGMLELDVLLGNFLNEAYCHLPLEIQDLFQKLLVYEDQDLFHWLIGKEKPTDPGLFIIVEKIREHAINRH